MATRTNSKIATFTKPFILGDFDEVLPAGDYVIDTDEDLLQGLSFSAYIRVAAIVHLPDKIGNPLLSRAQINRKKTTGFGHQLTASTWTGPRTKE